MKGKTTWNETPHRNPLASPDDIRICRLAPTETELIVQWVDGRNEGTYMLAWRPMFTADDWTRHFVTGYEAKLTQLTPWREYEIRIERMDGEASPKRYFRTAPVPGTVINYLHPHDDCYAFSGHALCSPNLVKHPKSEFVVRLR